MAAAKRAASAKNAAKPAEPVEPVVTVPDEPTEGVFVQLDESRWMLLPPGVPVPSAYKDHKQVPAKRDKDGHFSPPRKR